MLLPGHRRQVGGQRFVRTHGRRGWPPMLPVPRRLADSRAWPMRRTDLSASRDGSPRWLLLLRASASACRAQLLLPCTETAWPCGSRTDVRRRGGHGERKQRARETSANAVLTNHCTSADTSSSPLATLGTSAFGLMEMTRLGPLVCGSQQPDAERAQRWKRIRDATEAPRRPPNTAAAHQSITQLTLSLRSLSHSHSPVESRVAVGSARAAHRFLDRSTANATSVLMSSLPNLCPQPLPRTDRWNGLGAAAIAAAARDAG